MLQKNAIFTRYATKIHFFTHCATQKAICILCAIQNAIFTQYATQKAIVTHCAMKKYHF